MSEHAAEVLWERKGQTFLDKRYRRCYTFQFDGGARVPGSASPHVVPPPLSDEQAVDPEELFVASLSSCHMLWFLSIAAEQQFCVDHYRDSAVGWMEQASNGKPAMTRVTLRPEVRFSGDPLPTREQLDEMHHQAHEACFIANSVKTEIACEPLYTTL
ncbi:MAG: OsmC family protein [Planctomycetes bacterium]|nr:OsmC family protein [Planctomycetota bacterium]